MKKHHNWSITNISPALLWRTCRAKGNEFSNISISSFHESLLSSVLYRYELLSLTTSDVNNTLWYRSIWSVTTETKAWTYWIDMQYPEQCKVNRNFPRNLTNKFYKDSFYWTFRFLQEPTENPVWISSIENKPETYRSV